MPDLDIERSLWLSGINHIAGIDEAGRGPLAGPVVAAAVIVPQDFRIDGVDDSKKLSPSKREKLFEMICRHAIATSTAVVPSSIIDEINILRATMRAMTAAVEQLVPAPEFLLVDGPRFSGSAIPHRAVVDGDALCVSIAAASIVAKVTRDRLMIELDHHYPHYGFAKHKGYGTVEHYEAIKRFGPCEIHRRSFRLQPLALPTSYDHP